MLNHFRSFADNIVAKILLVLLVLSFVIWGIDDMVRSSGHGATLATVGSAKNTVEEFNTELKRATESLRRTLGNHFTPEMIKMTNLHIQVLQKLVNQKLLVMESQDLG